MAKNVGRILWYDPNPPDNRIVNTEDLSIAVDLKSRVKPRGTILVDGTDGSSRYSTTAVGGVTGGVGFLEGSQTSPGVRNLTTRYTDISTTLNVNDNQDFEALGIESIDIEFNTAYAPIVKIKFIDVRGADILGQGNQSKYRMFFDLPYPIFQLTVKGFFGKAVQYCLHLTRWNAAFNSETGNFEIQADFIGYTYALLTDLLVGLIRAGVKTNDGKKKLAEIKASYIPSIQPSIISIDELMVKISKVNNLIENIKERDPKILELRKTDFLNRRLELIEAAINKLSNGIYDGTPPRQYFNSGDGIIVIPWSDAQQFTTPDPNLPNTPTESKAFIAIQDYKKNVVELIKEFNQQAYGNVKLVEENFTTVNQLNAPLLGSEVKNDGTTLYSQLIAKVPNYAGGLAGAVDETVDEFADKVNDAIGSYSEIKANTELGYFEFQQAYISLDVAKKAVIKAEEDIRVEIGEQLSRETTKVLGFQPTIRNITRILTIHCEILLDLLYDVSVAAEGNANRKAEILKLIDSNNPTKNININKANIGTIYPWPEYRKKDDDEDGFTESWIGDDLFNKTVVNEVVFVEELLDALMQIVRDDVATQEVDTRGIIDWYPITILDTTLDERVVENPYSTAINGNGSLNIPDEATRILMQRGFLFMGLGSVTGYDEKLIRLKGRLEAHNLVEACYRLNTNNGSTIIDSILRETTDSLLNKWAAGPNDRAMFKRVGNDLKYTYISGSDGRAYIPVNGRFKSDEYYRADGTLKLNNEITALSIDTVIASNAAVGTTNNVDGSTTMRLYSTRLYETKSMIPNYASEVVDQYNKDVQGVIETNTMKNALSGGKKLANINPLAGRYSANDFSKVKYNGDQYKPIGENYDYGGESSVTAFYVQDVSRGRNKTKNGTYLSKVRLAKDANNVDNLYTLNLFGQYEIVTSPLAKDQPRNKKPQYWPDYTKQKDLLATLIGDSTTSSQSEVSLPFVEYSVTFDNNKNPLSISLFGSPLYYRQRTDAAKAFLFLHSFPWNGVLGLANNQFTMFDYEASLETFVVKGLFSNTESFITVPRLWVLFIGGVLWRYTSSVDQIDWAQGSITLLPGLNSGDIPNQDQYLYWQPDTNIATAGMNFGKRQNVGGGFQDRYKSIDEVILNLPEDIKKQFVNEFLNFAGGQTFQRIREGCEIADSFDEFVDLYLAVNPEVTVINGISKFNGQSISNQFKPDTAENYVYIAPLRPPRGANYQIYGFNLELKQRGVMSSILSLMGEKMIIQNANPRVWLANTVSRDIVVAENNMRLFIDGFLNELAIVGKDFGVVERNSEEQNQRRVFGSTDDSFIKLSIYRTLSSLYDKWIGASNGEFVNQCGFSSISQDLAKSERNGPDNDKPRLIDTFRFLDRSFRDIGDKLFINPIVVNSLLKSDYNQTFFDVINDILKDNNFNFIPLPTYVNFTEASVLENDIFKPYPWLEYADDGPTSGPAFICVYVGQISTALDLGPDSNYPDDGIFIRVDEDGNVTVDGDSGSDFILGSADSSKGEMNIPVFAVNYGQQNQSYFKGVKLDQREFTETAESLQIIEDLSQTGNKKEATYGGQNLFNVYQKRSYSAEVEMLGDALIQPMMYFQLNNIPMFRGLYLIIKVNHSIRANHMITKFKGVRVKKAKTPLLDRATLFMNLLGDLDALSREEITEKSIITNSTVQLYRFSPQSDTNPINGFISVPIVGYVTTGAPPDFAINTNNSNPYIDIDLANAAPYGMYEVIQVLQRVAVRLQQEFGGGYRMRINDIAKLGGGPLGKHVTHQLGLNIDIRPVSKPNSSGIRVSTPLTFRDSIYDREKTIRLIQIFFSEKYDAYIPPPDSDHDKTFGPQVAVKEILFNDPQVIAAFPPNSDGQQVRAVVNHDNHLHVTFNLPKRAQFEAENDFMNTRRPV